MIKKNNFLADIIENIDIGKTLKRSQIHKSYQPANYGLTLRERALCTVPVTNPWNKSKPQHSEFGRIHDKTGTTSIFCYFVGFHLNQQILVPYTYFMAFKKYF